MRRLVLIALVLSGFAAIPSANADTIVGGQPATRPYPFMVSLQRPPTARITAEEASSARAGC